MPREGAIIFCDLVGKLDVLNVECDKCGRRGRHHLGRLIERSGIDAKLFNWLDEITADCPRKKAQNGARTCRKLCEAFRCAWPIRVGAIEIWRQICSLFPIG